MAILIYIYEAYAMNVATPISLIQAYYFISYKRIVLENPKEQQESELNWIISAAYALRFFL